MLLPVFLLLEEEFLAAAKGSSLFCFDLSKDFLSDKIQMEMNIKVFSKTVTYFNNLI